MQTSAGNSTEDFAIQRDNVEPLMQIEQQLEKQDKVKRNNYALSRGR